MKSDTLMTLSFRCVALSVTPVDARMNPARQRRNTSEMDCHQRRLGSGGREIAPRITNSLQKR